jgi:uncharacterized protein (DUF302 family)
MSSPEGLITYPSSHSVTETLDRLQFLLYQKHITIFTRIDHSLEAKNVGMHMPPTQLLIFGSPRGGTPIMLAAPLAAIDLPLKALAWEDNAGKVWISYNDPQYLKKRYGLSDEVLQPISGIGALIQAAIS